MSATKEDATTAPVDQPHIKVGDLESMLEYELTNHRAFVINSALSCVAALVAGSLIDNLVRKIQSDCTEKREDALTYMVIQLAMNIAFLFVVSKINFRFVPWMQLSLSGMLFSMLFFAVQDGLLRNTLQATRF